MGGDLRGSRQSLVVRDPPEGSNGGREVHRAPEVVLEKVVPHGHRSERGSETRREAVERVW